MAFIAYTSEGKEVSFTHKIDYYEATSRGKFFKNPPGVKEKPVAVKEEPVVVEEIQEIEPIKPKPIKPEPEIEPIAVEPKQKSKKIKRTTK